MWEERTKHGMKVFPNPWFELYYIFSSNNGQFIVFGLNCFDRSTPIESLHTILLGACKYILCEFIDCITAAQRKEILVRVSAFPYYRFGTQITGNICYYFKSFVGRDFKSWMQMAIFIWQYIRFWRIVWWLENLSIFTSSAK